MRKNPQPARPGATSPVRCAIYTRKSTEEGLEQEFNSLAAQREAAQAYIASQQHAGWVCLPQSYDDGGYSGGSMDRPALTRLLTAIRAGQIDCVVTHRVDRLSRSLLDFAKMMETFDQHGVSFVSVTQQFHTATSMGRLVLNVLLSFAQFEREIIAERTRDKIAAARRKGLWCGGMPLLGYDVDPRGSKLVVQPEEAQRVRAIFALYRQHQALLPVVHELQQRGWVNKQWRTRQGHHRGGQAFTRASLYRLLTCVTYTGQIRYRGEVHPGAHPAIVDPALWHEVQALLQQHGPGSRGEPRTSSWAMLKGLLQCRSCGCAMTPTYTGKGTRRYRYYACTQVRHGGDRSCPARALPATAVEQNVVLQLQVLARATDRSPAERAWLAAVAEPAAWQALTTLEQAAVLRRLVQRVEYDGHQHTIAITLRPMPPTDPTISAPTPEGQP
jgi:site-specific DNA recombinase